MYSNIRGLSGKLSSLQIILGELEPDIVGLCETHMYSDRNISIDGCEFIRRPRQDKRCGVGIGFLVSDKVLRNITLHNKSDELELMWIRLELANKTPLYVGLYYSDQELHT